MGKVHLTLNILLIFTLYLISVGGGSSSEVRGYSGGGVLIKCKYVKEYTSNPKYFCKGSWLNCKDLIMTEVKNKWVNEGKFSLYDNTSSAEFWVKIRDLTVEDSGTYQCAVDRRSNLDIYTAVELQIDQDLNYEKSISVDGQVGQTVEISCNYPQSLSSKPKFFCRILGTASCTYKSSVEESKIWIEKGRFSLYDSRSIKTFTVSISSLTKEDSGEYWCGAESDWRSDPQYKVYFTQINLRVTDQVPSVKPSASQIPEATTSSTSTPTVPSASETSAGVLSPSSTSTSSLTTKVTPPTSKSASSSSSPTTGASSASAVIPVVGMILLLLLIGLLFFVVALRKKRNPQVTSPDQPLSDSSINRRVSHTVYDYEEIKDTKRHPTPDTAASTVYSTAQLPTDPSHPSQTLYDNVQLRTGPRDFSNPIYSTARLPTSPSDSSASDPQPVSVKPAEDPAYATVKFTKNDAVTTATANQEDDSCDYATVKIP